MAEDLMGGLFDDEDVAVDDGPDAYAQDGPDLFGTEPDELILPTEPTPTDDPEMDLPADEMSEIPVDPEADEDVEEADEAEADAPVA